MSPARRRRKNDRRKWRWSIVGIMGGFSLAGMGIRAAAQEAPSEGPVVIGAREQKKFRFLELEKTTYSVDLTGQYASSTANGVTTTQMIFEEYVGLSTTGYLFSPSFLDLNLAGRFGLSQASSKDTSDAGNSEQNNGTVYDYNVRGVLKRDSSLPVTATASRSQDLVNQTFGETLRNTTNTYGISTTYQSKTLPTTVSFMHDDQTQTGLTSATDSTQNGTFTSSNDVLNWHTEWRPSDHQSLVGDYRLTQSDQINEGTVAAESQQEIIADTQEAMLTHSYHFGQSHRSSLNSNLSYYNDSGTYTQERLVLDEQLHLQHSKSLETDYNYRYTDWTYLDTPQTLQEIKGGFPYRMFQSVTASGHVGATFQKFGDENASSDGQFADFNLGYSKMVPLGRLSLNGMTSISHQQNDARNSPTEVLDQPYTFNNFQPLSILQPFIDPSSIRITNPDHTFTYTRNLHYRVNTIPGGVEIQPIPGQFPNPVTPVLIDYTLRPEAANTQNTNSFGFGMKYEFTEGMFKGLGTYARYLVVDQTIDSADPTAFIPDNIRELTVGAEYKIWKFIFLAEWEDHESTVSPFVSTRFSGQFLHQAGRDTTLTANTQYQLIDYPSVDAGSLSHSSRTFSVGGGLDHRFSRALHGTLTANWLSDDDSSSGPSTGTDIDLRLEYYVRQTRIHGSVRRSSLSFEGSDTSFLMFEIGITRTF